MTIEALQTRVDELKTKVAAKASELKDGLPEADQKRIEAEHDVLVADYEAAKERLADAEFDAEDDEGTEEVRAVQAFDEAVAKRIADEAVAADRKRAADITDLATRAGFPEIGEEFIKKGKKVEEARVALFDAMAKQSEEGTRVSGITVDVSKENAEKRGAAIQAAILHRFDPSLFQKDFDANPTAREYRGLSLLEMAREDLEQKGVNVRGMSKMEVAHAALSQRVAGQDMNFRTGGMMSTSDFPNILANVMHKSLRAAYEAAPQTFRPLVRETTVPDFKDVTRVQLGNAPQFLLVNEHAEFTRGSMGEAAEKYHVATYGRVVAITRQVLINDDLNAFTRIPRAFGVQASQLESDLVWAQILGNPTMNSDNTALFHANHNNLTSSGSHPVNVTEISAARLAMAKQTDLDGKTVLNIRPKYLIVPMAQQTVVEQFYATIFPATGSNAIPESMKQFQIISDPRLDSGIASQGVTGNAFSWYLAADPSTIDLIELAYLEGNRGVYTETRMGFDVDGMEVKVRLDVGAKVLDWHGLYKVISTA